MISNLPGQSPVFIFPFSNQIEKEEAKEMLSASEEFLSQWKSHGASISAQAWIEESRFLLVAVDPSIAAPGGCSKDKLFRFVSDLKKSKNQESFPLHLFWIKGRNGLHPYTRKEMLQAWNEGILSPENQIFPTWVSTLEEHQKGWGKSLEEFADILKLPIRESII